MTIRVHFTGSGKSPFRFIDIAKQAGVTREIVVNHCTKGYHRGVVWPSRALSEPLRRLSIFVRQMPMRSSPALLLESAESELTRRLRVDPNVSLGGRVLSVSA